MKLYMLNSGLCVTIDTGGGAGGVGADVYSRGTETTRPLVSVFFGNEGSPRPQSGDKIPVYTGACPYPQGFKILPLGAALNLHTRFRGRFRQGFQQIPYPSLKAAFPVIVGKQPEIPISGLQRRNPALCPRILIIDAYNDTPQRPLQRGRQSGKISLMKAVIGKAAYKYRIIAPDYPPLPNPGGQLRHGRGNLPCGNRIGFNAFRIPVQGNHHIPKKPRILKFLRMTEQLPGIPCPENQGLRILRQQGHPSNLFYVERVGHIRKTRLQPFQEPVKTETGYVAAPGYADDHRGSIAQPEERGAEAITYNGCQSIRLYCS